MKMKPISKTAPAGMRKLGRGFGYAIITAFAFAACGCTTVPARFTRDNSVSDDGGYHVEQANATGFDLEIFYKSWSFMPNPDPAIQKAKSYWVQMATELARRNGRTIVHPSAADLHTSASRNIMDANYAVYVTGRVAYADPLKGPQ